MNIRQLRDTRKLKSWLQLGKTVDLLDRNQIIGRIVPEGAANAAVWPDFKARTTQVFGDRVLSGAELMIEERERF